MNETEYHLQEYECECISKSTQKHFKRRKSESFFRSFSPNNKNVQENVYTMNAFKYVSNLLAIVVELNCLYIYVYNCINMCKCIVTKENGNNFKV